ncbi:hypothetical protein GCM10009771_16990 [Nesterenkonia flava]
MSGHTEARVGWASAVTSGMAIVGAVLILWGVVSAFAPEPHSVYSPEKFFTTSIVAFCTAITTAVAALFPASRGRLAGSILTAVFAVGVVVVLAMWLDVDLITLIGEDSKFYAGSALILFSPAGGDATFYVTKSRTAQRG